jgi:hypothetical protein
MPQENLYHKEKSPMISLIDDDGKKTSEMKMLEDIYHKGKYGVFDLLAGKEDTPLGLSSKRVWELVHGKKKKLIRKDHFDYLVREFPIKGKFSDPDNLIIITPEIIQELEYHRIRSGISAGMLLKMSSESPKGLSRNIISDWTKGITKKAIRQNVEFVLEKWKELPDSYFFSKKNSKQTADCFERSLIELAPDFKERLSEYISNSGLSLLGVLKSWRPLPSHLDLEVVSGWMSGDIKRATPEHIDFVIEKIGHKDQ